MTEELTPAVSCIMPNGKHCEHAEKDHYPNPLGIGARNYCFKCWDGREILGPFIHDYNPHVLTMAGWLPT